MNSRHSKRPAFSLWAVAVVLVASGAIFTVAGAWALSVELKTGDQVRALWQQAKQQQEAQP